MSAVLDAESCAASKPDQAEGTKRFIGGDHLTFCVGDERYAVDILKVQELRSFEKPTRIVGAPACVLGVNNLRGTIVPIVDLRQLLGCGPVQESASTVVIVLAFEKRVVGAVVDSVTDVTYFVPEKVRETPAMNGGATTEHISGLYPLDREAAQEMLIVLDIEALVREYVGGLSY